MGRFAPRRDVQAFVPDTTDDGQACSSPGGACRALRVEQWHARMLSVQVYMPSGGGCQLDAGDQDYCALSGAGDSSSLCSLPSLVLDGLAWLAEWYSGADNVISADDLKSNEPGLCCSAFGDHGITAYVAALNSTCMDACSQLQLCLCQTYFEQPQAANADPEAFLSPSPPAYRPPAYGGWWIGAVGGACTWAGVTVCTSPLLISASMFAPVMRCAAGCPALSSRQAKLAPDLCRHLYSNDCDQL